MKVLITGGCGFIGSNLIRKLLKDTNYTLLNVDNLSYAATGGNLDDVQDARYTFVEADICDEPRMKELVRSFAPAAIIHMAAESHVDKSIGGAADFVRTNVDGTRVMLEAAREAPLDCLFLYFSTDEVYGEKLRGSSSELDLLCPGNPYSATKAAGEMLVRAYHKTFGINFIIVRPSNNYGPHQFPEKLIPMTITKALRNKPIYIYRRGLGIRDWIHVEDTCEATLCLARNLRRERQCQAYNIGGKNTLRNATVVSAILKKLGKPESLIRHIDGRPGEDKRYSLSNFKMNQCFGWAPQKSFREGLEETISWYVENPRWWEKLEIFYNFTE